MTWKMMFAMVLAVGSLTATVARAQENPAPAEATATDAQIAHPENAADETHGQESQTVDADGALVAKPNPMSDFLERARQLGNAPVEMPLVDDFRTDGTGTDGQTK